MNQQASAARIKSETLKKSEIVDIKVGQNSKEKQSKNDIKNLIVEINRVRPIHKKRGICYTSTVTALSAYRGVKFNSIEAKRERYIETLKAKDIDIEEYNPFHVVFEKLSLLDRHNKNLTDNIENKLLESASLIQRIDIALGQSFRTGSRIVTKEEIMENEIIKQIVEQKYILFKTALLSTDELIALSGYKKSAYYEKLEEGTQKISIALWGAFGETHPQLNAMLKNIINKK